MMDIIRLYLAAKEELERMKIEVPKMRKSALEAMQEAGVEQVKVDGWTVYIHKGVNNATIVENPYLPETTDEKHARASAALREAGLDWVAGSVRVNMPEVGKALREIMEDSDFPAELRGVIHMNRVPNVNVKRS